MQLLIRKSTQSALALADRQRKIRMILNVPGTLKQAVKSVYNSVLSSLPILDGDPIAILAGQINTTEQLQLAVFRIK